MIQKLPPLLIPLVAVSLLLLWTVLGFYFTPSLEEAYRSTLRSSARTAMVFFILAFIASPVAYLGSNTKSRWLLLQRRQLGIATGLCMLWHIIFIFIFFAGARTLPEPTTLVIAGGGLVLAMVMLLTSNNSSVRYLGKNWSRLHRLGLYYLWLIFTGAAVAVIYDVTGSGAWVGWIMLAGLLAAMLLRGITWFDQFQTKRRLASD